MTTDPTPHTERAAAAAAEISGYFVESVKPSHVEYATAIIAKHFNDDALRLAAGRALELLREAPYYDKPRDPIAAAITALSAALAGDKGKDGVKSMINENDPWDAKKRDLEEALAEAECTQEELEECGDLEERLEAAQSVDDLQQRLTAHLLKDHQEDTP